MDDSYDYLFKVLLIGDSSVGKTSVLLRYTDRTFTPSFQATIGVDFRIANFSMNDKKIKLQLWDTAGQDRYRSIVSSYYRGAQGLIIVYDVTNINSFKNVTHWFEQCNPRLPTTSKLLIGNKCDLLAQRKVTFEQGKDLADSLGMSFLETSAKNSINIDECFSKLTGNMLDANAVRSSSNVNIGLRGGKEVSSGTKWCCSS